MVIPIEAEFGHSVPPEGPHTVTVYCKGWETATRFRDGDGSLVAQMRSMYPRFMPWGSVMQLSMALKTALNVPETHGLLPFTDPKVFADGAAYVKSAHRQPKGKLAPADLGCRVVDVAGTRLYCLTYPMACTPGIIGMWQNPGIGLSTRAAEALLPHVAGPAATAEVPCAFDPASGAGEVPAPTYLPETEAHARLRERIVALLHRAPRVPDLVRVAAAHVHLVQSGMAAIWRAHQALQAVRPGTVVVLGAVFHSSWYVFEENPGGFRHFGDCSARSGVVEKAAAFLEGEKEKGKTVSYLFVEVPSNPILVTVDLQRLKEVSTKYNVPLIVDETIGSFANIDVLPEADLIVTSLTKTFSGYADVMGGSLVLNPLSAHYPSLSTALSALVRDRNELAAGDAAALLANSADYLSRTAVLNRNAAAAAAYLEARRAADPARGPVARVLYVPQTDTAHHYAALMRRPTGALTPGHGCLLSVQLRSVARARAFYDHLGFYHGPHLGAHVSLAVCYNHLAYGRVAAEARYHAAYGCAEEQVRLSVGLESEADIVDTLRLALDKAAEVGAGEEEEGAVPGGMPDGEVAEEVPSAEPLP